jgi:hypothetical protein
MRAENNCDGGTIRRIAGFGKTSMRNAALLTRDSRSSFRFYCEKAGLALYTETCCACCMCEEVMHIPCGLDVIRLRVQVDLPRLTLDPLAKDDYDCFKSAKERQE